MPARFRELLVQAAATVSGDSASVSTTASRTAKAKAGGVASSVSSAPAEDAELQLIITTGIDRCLVAYPPARWAQFEAKLAALSQFDRNVVKLKRIYVAGATECSIDRQGRLLIPPVLRDYAGIDRDVVWAGMVDIIELWSKERWQGNQDTAREDPESIARAMAELGL